MTATRVDRNSASCRLWVTKITVLRVRRQMSRSHSPMSTRVCSSRAPKGSSIKRIFQEDLRVDRERAADRDALLHAPGELARVLAREPLEAERAEELRRDRAPALGGHAPELEAELHVLERRPPGKEARVLEHGRDAARVGPRDRLAVDQNAPAVRVNEAPEHSEERGLAAAGRADQRAELALAYRERDVVERLDRPR